MCRDRRLGPLLMSVACSWVELSVRVSTWVVASPLTLLDLLAMNATVVRATVGGHVFLTLGPP